MATSDVIFDWNLEGPVHHPRVDRIAIIDETLRDGIQSPSITDPSIEDKMRIVRLLSEVGVDSLDVGLPGAGPRAVADSEALVRFIRDEKLAIKPQCAARTHPADIRPVIEIAERVGIPVEVMTFLGTSPVRLYAEGWDEEVLEERCRTAVRMAKDAGLPCTFVTEDTVRSQPTVLRRLFTAAIEEGADGLALCDTVGHATPVGVTNLVRFARDLVRGMGTDTRLDWHGHDDRGYSLINAVAAVEAGVDRVHGTVLGVGERVGNTPLDLLMVNLKLMGVLHQDLGRLAELVDLVAEATDWPVHPGYPVFGRDAFRTGTGVHAAAVIKAMNKGDDDLADRVYSGVPASWFGRRQEIEIGHMAGDSNILYWLRVRGIETEEGLVAEIRKLAKSVGRVLEEEEVMAVVRRWRGEG